MLWILSENKNKILVYLESFKGHSRKNWKIAHDLGFDLVFKYVNTSDNPADLITRGIYFGQVQV